MERPFEIIERRHITEKTTMLEQLHTAQSNKSLAKCQSAKYVFLVHPEANKQEIATSIESIYREQSVKVAKVNTINAKRKPKRRGRGRPGKTAAFKKAIVTLQPGDTLDNV